MKFTCLEKVRGQFPVLSAKDDSLGLVPDVGKVATSPQYLNSHSTYLNRCSWTLKLFKQQETYFWLCKAFFEVLHQTHLTFSLNCTLFHRGLDLKKIKKTAGNYSIPGLKKYNIFI